MDKTVITIFQGSVVTNQICCNATVGQSPNRNVFV